MLLDSTAHIFDFKTLPPIVRPFTISLNLCWTDFSLDLFASVDFFRSTSFAITTREPREEGYREKYGG